MIWDRLPKGVFIGSETLQLGVYDAVAHFNIGCQVAVNVLTNLGMEPGKFCLEPSEKADRRQIQKGRRQYKEEKNNLESTEKTQRG